jgi:O-acetylserine/cysteine efflux transporter
MNILLAVVVAVIWGLNFVVIKIGLGAFPPLLFSAMRFSLAALPAAGLVGRNGVPWRWIIPIGLVTGVVSNGLLFVGMSYGMSAGLSSLVMQTHVIITILLSWVLWRESLSWRQIAGVVVAFLGIGLLAGRMQPAGTLLGFMLAVGSAAAFAVTTILLKQAGAVDMRRLAVWISVIPPLPLLALSLIMEDGQWQAVRHLSWSGVGALAYTSVISSILAFAIWGKLVKLYSPGAVAPFGLLVPVFGLLSARVCLGEQYNSTEMVASVLVTAGLLMVVLVRTSHGALDSRGETRIADSASVGWQPDVR